ncbi:MAG: STAS domain-containing protein, partial [archaeon]
MYQLPENLDIYSIDEIKQDLMNYIEEKIEKDEQEIVIDGSKTEDLDAAGLQILISAYKTAKHEGLFWKIINQGE